MTLHPLLAARFAERDRRGAPSRADGTVAQARAQMAADRRALGTGPDVGSIQSLTLPTRGGSVAAKLYRPVGVARATMVFLHGGGWVMGSLLDYDALARSLCARTRSALLLVDYRLAPEHPFPAALEDSEDALRWAAHELEGPLLLAGDSAGANLAAAAACALRTELPIALQLLLYPVTDCDMQRESYRMYGSGYGLDTRDMAWFLEHYASGHDWTDPRISPLRTPDFSGLAPTWIATAQCDVLADEGAAYAQRLTTAGVPTALHTYAGMAHGFAPLFNLLDVSRQLQDDVAAAVDWAIAPHSFSPP